MILSRYHGNNQGSFCKLSIVYVKGTKVSKHVRMFMVFELLLINLKKCLPLHHVTLLWGIIGKAVLCLAAKHYMDFSSDIQIRCVLVKNCVARLLSTQWEIFTSKRKTEAVILKDVANAFKGINRRFYFQVSTFFWIV